MNRPGGYIDVDKLQAETTLEQAAALCGYPLVTKGSSPEVRIDCPFECHGDHAGRKEVAINIENPQKVFQCHGYQCGVRGNLLTLMHGFLTGALPTGGKLKGTEFQRVKRVLAGSGESSEASPTRQVPEDVKPVVTPPLSTNTPLIDSSDQRVRELHNIDEKLIRDISVMNPAAAAYVRRHPCLTPEAMAKWRCGYLPNDGGGDKRGWSLRGSILYPVLSENGKVLTWVGRDVLHEAKERDYQQLTPAERQSQEPPAKHRFPKGFHRGQELFGQHAARLTEPGYREFIQQHGLTLVEGFNDVINLDTLGIPALAIMSNRMTDAQGEKVIRFMKHLGTTRVNLMFDCDDPGTAGAKEALWFFAEKQIDVTVAWSETELCKTNRECQPERINDGDLQSILLGMQANR
jgi:5S rRNA maturation endonuclease (ribonuclease M5)